MDKTDKNIILFYLLLSILAMIAVSLELGRCRIENKILLSRSHDLFLENASLQIQVYVLEDRNHKLLNRKWDLEEKYEGK